MRRFSVLLGGIGLFVACGGGSSDSSNGDKGKPDGRDTIIVPAGCPIEPPAEAEVGIRDECGIFVSSSKGSSGGEGTSIAPLASVQKGMEMAREKGKRLFVCAQSYREQLTLVDGISMFGYLDCSGPTWKVGKSRAVIDGPASPTVKATALRDMRMDGFEIRSPDAATPSGSSIAMVVMGSSGLKIVNSKVRAGSGARGTDGVERAPLIAERANGEPPVAEETCGNDDACVDRHLRTPPRGGQGICNGAYLSPSGGPGGQGGYYDSSGSFGPWRVRTTPAQGYPWDPSPYSGPGGGINGNPPASAGRPGAPGTDGVSGSSFGKMTDEVNYAASNGSNGTDGQPGQAGGGGGGQHPKRGAGATFDEIWTTTGGGGGAGGCPGLAGTAGTGGGASIGIVAIQSPIQLFTSVVETSPGGDGGRGTVGSPPTSGGEPGTLSTLPSANGGHGGAGGRAGVSGSGGGGPSIGIIFRGGAPILTSTDITPGAGGAGVAVPESPKGISTRTREF